jgi:hypothetical protein
MPLISVAIACLGEGDESDERVAFARVMLLTDFFILTETEHAA